jgi:glycosyltransferase 2 family protein
MRRTLAGTLIRLLVAIALLLFLFSRVNAEQVLASMAQATPTYVLLAIVLYLGAILSNALRWGILLRAQGVEVPWPALLRYTFVGLFFNNLLPAAVGGDVMRGYGVARDTRRRADAAVSVVVDRIIGLLALTSSAIVAVLYAQFRHAAGGADLEATFWIAVVATAALVTGFLLMISRRMRQGVGGILTRVAERVVLLRPLIPVYEKLAGSIGAYRHQPGVIFLAFGIALFTWLFSNLVNYLLSISLHAPGSTQTPVSLLHIFIFNPLVGLAQLVPLSIGGLGLNQNLYDGFYHQLLGYNQAHVVALSFLMQFVIYLTSLPGAFIWWLGRSRAVPPPAVEARHGPNKV